MTGVLGLKIEEGLQGGAGYRKCPQYIGMMSANLLNFAVGTALGWTSPARPLLFQGEAGYTVDEYQFSWITSIGIVGSLITVPVQGYLSDRFGNKVLMLGSGLVNMLGWCLVIWGNTVELMYAGRLVLGLVLGTSFFITPYTAEIAHKEIRGAITGYHAVALYIGIAFSYAVGSSLSLYWTSITCAFVPTIPFLVTFPFFPETPAFLLGRGRPDEARRSLRFFRGPGYDLEPEFRELTGVVVLQSLSTESHWAALMSRKTIKGLAIGIVLVVVQQMTGIGTTIANAVFIFQEAGSGLHPKISTIVLGVVSVIAHWLNPFIVDRFGRVKLLVAFGICITLSNVGLGVFFCFSQNGYEISHLGWLPMACMWVFICAYSVSWGPVVMLVVAEVLPCKVRGAAQAIVFTFLNAVFFLLLKFYSDLNAVLGWYGTFWLYAVCCAAGTAFAAFVIPETNGKSFEEIQKDL